MLNRSLILLVALAAVSFTSTASAELKIGVYDNRAILSSLPSLKKEEEKLQAEFAPKQKEFSDKQKFLISLQEDLEKNSAILSASERRAKELEFASKRRELQLLSEDTERLLNVRRNEVARKIQNMVFQEAKKMASEEGYDLVINTGIIHASPKVDFTSKLLERLANK